MCYNYKLVISYRLYFIGAAIRMGTFETAPHRGFIWSPGNEILSNAFSEMIRMVTDVSSLQKTMHFSYSDNLVPWYTVVKAVTV